LKIKIQGNNKRGKFKLIQTTADQQLTTIWSGEKDEEVILNIPKGSSAIKWVGQKAAGELNIQLDTKMDWRLNLKLICIMGRYLRVDSLEKNDCL
jgi:hypothetical protein